MTVWHVVKTKPQAELRACDELQAVGLETMAPTYVRAHWRAKRKVERKEPHLRRYVCVAADTETVIWREAPKCKHVTGPLMSGERIARLRPAEAIRVKKMQDEKPKESAPFEEGQRVRINAGPFLGREGPVTYCNAVIAQVAISFLGKQVEAPIAVEAISAV